MKPSKTIGSRTIKFGNTTFRAIVIKDLGSFRLNDGRPVVKIGDSEDRISDVYEYIPQ